MNSSRSRARFRGLSGAGQRDPAELQLREPHQLREARRARRRGRPARWRSWSRRPRRGRSPGTPRRRSAAARGSRRGLPARLSRRRAGTSRWDCSDARRRSRACAARARASSASRWMRQPASGRMHERVAHEAHGLERGEHVEERVARRGDQDLVARIGEQLEEQRVALAAARRQQQVLRIDGLAARGVVGADRGPRAGEAAGIGLVVERRGRGERGEDLGLRVAQPARVGFELVRSRMRAPARGARPAPRPARSAPDRRRSARRSGAPEPPGRGAPVAGRACQSGEAAAEASRPRRSSAAGPRQ